jgi:hypothetical protein
MTRASLTTSGMMRLVALRAARRAGRGRHRADLARDRPEEFPAVGEEGLPSSLNAGLRCRRWQASKSQLRTEFYDKKQIAEGLVFASKAGNKLFKDG